MKNKLILAATCLFSVLFLGYIFKLTDEIQRDEEILESSPNILDVTDKIKTKILVTHEDLPTEAWSTAYFDGLNWQEERIPKFQIIKDPNYKDGGYVYYRIFVPKAETEKLIHLKGELDLSLQLVTISKSEIYVNGKFVRTNTPNTYIQSMLSFPVQAGVDNIVSIKGHLKDGDRGIEHRGKIYLGKSAELNSIYSFSYRGNTIFPLIFVLCKGSVIFVFGLIYLLLNVGKFFEKSLLFSLFAVGEDVLTGDFLTSFINLNGRALLHNLFSFGACVFLFLFLGDVVGKSFKKKNIYLISIFLGCFSFLMISDVLYSGHVFTFDIYLKFWVSLSVLTLGYYLPQVYRVDKVLFGVLLTAIVMTVWSTIGGANVGMNLKLFSNLLLFFMVAYQSFALFRREQLKLQEQEIQLIEQEKDVAIGKTASLLAHDVRRPLEQMKLILDKVSSGQVSDEFIKAARSDVNFSITSVNNQINDIMNYSKSRPADLGEISFYSVLSGSLKQIMTINRNLDLKLVCDFKAQMKVLGDESRLAGALTNLLSNAVEAIRDIGKKTSGEIRMTTEIINHKFVFRIHNDGPAIPENVLKDIWRPMFTMGKEQGTGLGLSSVLKTIQDHNGEINVRNTGAGVEFEIQLKPASATDKVSDYEFHSASRDYNYDVKQAQISKLRPLRIFLLDDDIQVQEYFQSLIKNLPFHVDLTFVTHYESARQAVNAKRYDLYILDHDLGGGVSGEDFRKDNLAYLGDEVLIHSRKPMPFEELLNACESVYRKRLKILLVDDGELTLMAWEMFHGKHNIRTANSPEMALKILEDSQNQFDLAIVDYYFDNSSMTGEALAHKLKTMNPELPIVLSSNSELKISGFRSIEKNHFDVRTLGLSAKT